MPERKRRSGRSEKHRRMMFGQTTRMIAKDDTADGNSKRANRARGSIKSFKTLQTLDIRHVNRLSL